MNKVSRIKNSFGKNFVNEGTSNEYSQDRYILDNTRKFYLFDICPVGAVRMTKRDRIFTNPNHADPLKRQRKAVTMYFEFKNSLTAQALQMDYVLGETLDAVYLLPMPDSWSEKKKARMNGFAHKSTPDTDNITKGFCDALKSQDSDVWYQKAQKYWAYRGSIIIFD